MPLDESLLALHRRYEDVRRGFSEEFVRANLGGGSTVAVLSRPLGPSHPIGWVLCHSFGLEQINLDQLDVIMARTLAAAGFTCLRFHAQGYGESERRQVTLDGHVSGAVDAVALLQEEPGLRRVGAMGARFGAFVAALAAERAALAVLAMWQPVSNGAVFLRDYVQRERLAGMAGPSPHAGDGGSALTEDLHRQGWCDLNGFTLTRRTFEDISEIELTEAIHRFRGRVMLGAVTHTGRIPREVTGLARHFQALGAACSIEVVRDREGPMFGQHRFQKLADGRGERDRFFHLYGEVAGRTAAWSRGLVATEGSLEVPA